MTKVTFIKTKKNIVFIVKEKTKIYILGFDNNKNIIKIKNIDFNNILEKQINGFGIELNNAIHFINLDRKTILKNALYIKTKKYKEIINNLKNELYKHI